MLDSIVIGAGHSGLICAHLLQQANIPYLVLDMQQHIGDVWRMRPPSLRLFTSRQFCRLADVLMPGDPHSYPLASEFADHLAQFAREKELKVQMNSRVVSVTRPDGEYFLITLEDGTYIHSKTVIYATGSNQTPRVPSWAKNIAPHVQQIFAKDFKADAFRHDEKKNSKIAVVGDGASGRQIAMELAMLGYKNVHLACGRKRALLPNVVLGHDIFCWLKRLGLLFAPRDSLVAKTMRKRDPIPAAAVNNTHLSAAGVHIQPRLIDAKDDIAYFADQTTQSVDTIIWCQGYQEDMGCLNLPNIQTPECLSQGQGKTPEAGFYVIGRKWLTCRASELILGSMHDARLIMQYLQNHLKHR